MRISVHIRGNSNLTDGRSLALAAGLSSLRGLTVELRNRNETPKNADLVVQTGFARSAALMWAIEHNIPYLVMEGGLFRSWQDVHTHSSYTYNGMQNGGTRGPAGDYPRWHPKIKERHSGKTLILGQKPDDHSLRGADHVAWLLEKRAEYPEAEFRPNPIMVPSGTLEPLLDVLPDVGRTVSYTSTAAVESVFAGCETVVDSPASEAYQHGDREEWAHRLSWANFAHPELSTGIIAEHILGGYEEAYANAKAGQVEIPREKVRGAALMDYYYRNFPY